MTDMQTMRTLLHEAARNAVYYGDTDKNWANSWLARLGAETINVKSEYRINVPITGVYGRRITASSRAEALRVFQSHVERVAKAGKITADGSYDNVYKVALNPAAGDVQFYSGPEDADTEAALELDEDGLKQQIRAMLREGVSTQSWRLDYANDTLGQMGVDPLPEVVQKTVDVPVMGTATVSVIVFADEQNDADVREKAKKIIAAKPTVKTVVSEIGDEIAVAGF